MDISFDCRNLTESDYVELCDWWDFWPSWEPTPRFMLPDNMANGLMVSYKGKNLCSGFIYSTSSSSVFHCEYIVSSYKIKDKKVRSEGILFLMKGLRYMAEQMGAKVIYTSLNNEFLIDYYLKCGYIKGSENCTEMVYIKH